MIKAVLLDVDGVLYDSMPLHAKAWVDACRKWNLKLPSKLVYEAEGMKDKRALRYMLTKLNKKLSEKIIENICAEKVRLFNTYATPKIIPGAKKFINKLRERKIKINLVTGSFQTKTVLRLKKDFSVSSRFVITGNDVTHGKPHPEPYLMALKRLKVKASDALVIENAPLGIRSAIRAGIPCIVINTGPLSKKELLGKKPLRIFKGFKEIAQQF